MLVVAAASAPSAYRGHLGTRARSDNPPPKRVSQMFPPVKKTIQHYTKNYSSCSGRHHRGPIMLPPPTDSKVVHDLWNDAIFSNLELPLTQTSRLRYYMTLNISETVQEYKIHSFNGILIARDLHTPYSSVISNDVE